MDSDSSFIDTTYSQDVRIAQEIQETKKKIKLERQAVDLRRKRDFEEYSLEHADFFDLPGFVFLHFTHKRVKFYFRPCDVVEFVSKKTIFYCSLRYVKDHWVVKRDSFPSNIKWSIYSLFWNEERFTVNDSELIDVISRIYERLIMWSQKEEEFRKQRHQRYVSGEDMELYSDDEELFLTDLERKELWQKRQAIWRRMLPPN